VGVRLASVEVIPYALPFKQPYVTARGTLTRREMVLLRLTSDEGVVGLGEAVPLSLRGGVTIETVVAELEELGSLTDLDETTLGGPALGLSAPGRCAALTALLDLRSQDAVEGRRRADFGPPGPVFGPSARGVRCNATLVAGEPAAVAEDALGWAAEGYRTFKLKLGVGDDVGQVRAVREAVGPEAKIRVDVNAAWDVESAARTLAELEAYDLELAEQPVASLAELAQLAGRTAVPLAGDESIESPADAELAASMGACRMAGIKLSKVGGPEEAIAIAAVIPSYLSSALDGPVGIAAAARVAQTLRDTATTGGAGPAHGLATQRLFASTIASVECELRDGMLYPPSGPGLGVEIDEDALDAHRL
jgi:muconate cycloisomerase